jgi:hypothetical protein
VMTVVTAVFLPLILAYQGWTYYVFRQRLGRAVVAAPTGGTAPLQIPSQRLPVRSDSRQDDARLVGDPETARRPPSTS